VIFLVIVNQNMSGLMQTQDVWNVCAETWRTSL